MLQRGHLKSVVKFLKESLHNCVIKLHDNFRQSDIYAYCVKSFESFCRMKLLGNVSQY